MSSGKGMGSGVVVDKGLILTNRHVVSDTQILTVKTANGRDYQARVVARDQTFDLALLQFSGLDVPNLALGDPGQFRLGDPLIAIGYPLDLKGEATVTRGLLSALRVGEPASGEWVQTDAAVNPGNSGGPLVNMRGELAGLVTMATKWDNYTPVEGVNFALSAGIIRDILPAMRLAVGQMPPGTSLASEEVAREVTQLIMQIDDVKMEAYRSGDPSPMKHLVSPVYYELFASRFKRPPTAARIESKMVDFQVRAVYVLPGDVAIADDFEVWQTK
ncbi:MAG: trypsin-like peptidase domain-containing protein [Chloroflexi bacterium]|nr:trypsin-like peptidase domain-containing protein [Chloroflexota bacterium]